MSQSFSRLLIICAMAATLALGLTCGQAQADDAKTLLKKINSELRLAEKDMFAGKTDGAIAKLGPIREKLDQVKQADPNNNRLKSYEKKYLKLVKDLERRTGKNLGGGSKTAAASSSTKLPPKPTVKPVATKPQAAPSAGSAKDQAKEQAKQVGNLLRQAEKAVFAGKIDQATNDLAQAKQVMDQLKAADPNNRSLSGLQSKYNQLERRIASKTKPAGSTKPAAAPTKTATKSGGDKLPYGARQPLQQAKNSVGRLDRYLNQLTDPNYPGDKKQVANNAAKSIAHARNNLASAREEAAKKGVNSHPDFDQLEAQLNEAEKKIAGAAAGAEKEAAQAAAATEEVMADTAKLKAVYDRVSPVLNKATGTVIYYNDLRPVKELIGLVENFEAKEKAGVEKALAEFSAKYGSTAEQIDGKAKGMGYSGNYRASYAFTELTNGLKNVAKTRTVMADDLIRKAEEMKGRSQKGLHDFFRVKNYAKLKEWAASAAQLDKNNPRVTAFQAGLDGWIKQDMADLTAKIDKATWPSQAAGAPSDAAKLTAVGKEFMQQESDKYAAKGKEPKKIIGLVITGPWRVFKKNILGEPIQWGLPMRWAEVWQSEQGLDLARVYTGTLLTQEFKGVKKAPPFIGAAVGDSYYIRPGKVK